MSEPFTKIEALDHLVLTCRDIAATTSWYRNLGLTTETFTSPKDTSTTRTALKFGNQKINLHQAGAEFEPKATTALPGTADLCFLIQPATDLDKLCEKFMQNGIEVLEGGKAVERTGARGTIRSVYVRDPDGNLIELSKYPEHNSS